VSVPRNNVKIEKERISGVPFNLTNTVNSGDLLIFDTVNKVARAAVASDQANATSAANFIGVSNDTNPIPSIKQNLPVPRITVITRAICLFTADDNATYFVGDAVTIGSDPQRVQKTGASGGAVIGFVAPENFFTVTAGASQGIVATQGVTTLLIAIKPNNTNLATI